MAERLQVVSTFAPAGDQPKAIGSLAAGVLRGDRFQTLRGITGSGKSATIAWTIEAVQRPTLILAPNKSLAAQLANEMKDFFPQNRVEYFVSYYDYYQPEAYIPSSDTYIEKDSSINDEIDRLRHSATAALLTRRDVIVVASVSCIYGMGNPDEYRGQLLELHTGVDYDQRSILRRLVDLQYDRNDMTLGRGKFRVRGDTIEVHPAYEETVLRIEMFGDTVDRLTVVDPLTGEQFREHSEILLFPATHYVTGNERMQKAVLGIEAELQVQLAQFEKEAKLLEAQRLRMRTQYDLEMIQEVGYCNGIENYSMHIDGRSYGDPPFTLLDYFPDDFLLVIDESHQTVPQLHGQYEGDRSRKDTLVAHGFRLPSARDNRPLRFEEIMERLNQVIFLSATPSPYELRISQQVVEQIVRPTGLVDPEVIVKPTKGQIDDLIGQINTRVTMGDRVLVTTLTKKMAEDLTDYLLEQGLRVRYLHSNIDTIQRIEILRGLRLGDFDVLVGINLLREGLDLPEVSLVAILDADKEGFLRSETSLIQMIGRAARNVDGQVIMYADNVTDSMTRAISETNRRRGMQVAHNAEHGINPQSIRKAVTDILSMLRPDSDTPMPGRDRRKQRERDKVKRELRDLPQSELGRLIQTLEDEMHEASAELRFEYAARLRDEIADLKRELRAKRADVVAERAKLVPVGTKAHHLYSWRMWPGRSYPLGATWDGRGVNFALFAGRAEAVELCLFDDSDGWNELHRLTLTERTDQVWHAYLPDAAPGLVYGYRVHGPYDPARGLRFNADKVVLDPYAKAIARDVIWNDALLGHAPDTDLTIDWRDSAPYAPLAAVAETAFTWGDDRRPETPWEKTIIYELHVKGFTKRHPDVPEHLRGTYAGLASPAAIDHLLDLGVTAVELMPVHYHVDEVGLVRRGQTNYWGYSTLGFFAPDPRFGSGPPTTVLTEFKKMVRQLHVAGIEVILDVVYNHTAEGDHLGPTLSFRGIDNPAYYRLAPENMRLHVDFTGTGNSLNMLEPRVLQLIMDSLRYWVLDMHVDGFRFDLASTLARELHDVDRLASFFDIVHQDPVLSQVKLIAEPWDVGPGGYQVGNFPVLWSEWNGKYRDTLRRFWRGDHGTLGELASRLSGSSDLYQESGRGPAASINFVTAHDGFTLVDLVSYNQKHNEANGEGNRDGNPSNDSWNHGVEGDTDDPDILALRERQRRNILASMLFSIGVPMILSGDEIGHTTGGNNNVYCQDNELAWLDWDLSPAKREFLAFVRRVVAIRMSQPVFQRRKFFDGVPTEGTTLKDLYWIKPDGTEMWGDEDWYSGALAIGVGLVGDQIEEVDYHGNRIVGPTVAMLLNASDEAVVFRSPPTADAVWELLVDTARPHDAGGPLEGDHGYDGYELAPRSLVLLRLIAGTAVPTPHRPV